MPQFSTSYQRYGGRFRSLRSGLICFNQQAICSNHRTAASPPIAGGWGMLGTLGDGVLLVTVVM
jgi:hypothetical protein